MATIEPRSLPRSIGTAVLGPLLHRDSMDPPRGAGRLAVRLNQSLFERSMAPPWVFSSVQCRNYWSAPPDAGNEPITYANKPRAIVGFLDRFWRPEVGSRSSILEVGCNAGANLHGLHELGYGDLRAVEINGAAVEEMKRSFPAVAAAADVTVGSFEQVLPTMPGDGVDAVFTMAVLMHVHPKSAEVFAHIARIARGHICVIEPESATTAYIFARNYRRIFEREGCTEIRSQLISPDEFPELSPEYTGYTARLFRAPA